MTKKMESLKLMFLYALSKLDPYALTNDVLRIEKNKLLVGSKTYNIGKNIYVIGFGKAVLGMAMATENILSDDIVDGIISVPKYNERFYANKYNTSKLKTIKLYHGASHNLPDQNSMDTTLKIIEFCKTLNKTEDSLLLVLISGGGSALLCAPKPPLTLDQQLNIIKQLTAKGADIKQLNVVRSSLSLVKGGKLPSFVPPNTQIISLIISDIVGDPLEYIASGPTVSPNFSHRQALLILEQYNLIKLLPKEIYEFLASSTSSYAADTLQYSNKVDERVQNMLIGNNTIGLKAVASKAQSLGYVPIIISNQVTGEAKIFGSYLADLGLKIMNRCEERIKKINDDSLSSLDLDPSDKFDIQTLRASNDFFDTTQKMVDQMNEEILIQLLHKSKIQTGPDNQRQEVTKIALIFGGETTVTMESGIQDGGKGGRNQEIALAFLNRMAYHDNDPGSLDYRVPRYEDIILLSAGTDGQDGPTDAAGALAQYNERSNDGFYLETLSYLQNHDSYRFWDRYENGKYHIKPGLTGTNVMDIQILSLKITC